MRSRARLAGGRRAGVLRWCTVQSPARTGSTCRTAATDSEFYSAYFTASPVQTTEAPGGFGRGNCLRAQGDRGAQGAPTIPAAPKAPRWVHPKHGSKAIHPHDAARDISCRGVVGIPYQSDNSVGKSVGLQPDRLTDRIVGLVGNSNDPPAGNVTGSVVPQRDAARDIPPVCGGGAWYPGRVGPGDGGCFAEYGATYPNVPGGSPWSRALDAPTAAPSAPRGWWGPPEPPCRPGREGNCPAQTPLEPPWFAPGRGRAGLCTVHHLNTPALRPPANLARERIEQRHQSAVQGFRGFSYFQKRGE
eukprot:gene22797-biopygen2776